MKKLNEHRLFRNQCILMTLLIFAFGGILLFPFEFLSDDASEGAFTLFGFGFIMALISLFNIYTYRQNKKDYEKIKNL